MLSREDKTAAASYELEPSTPASLNVDRVKDESSIKKEIKQEGKSKKGKGKPPIKKLKVKVSLYIRTITLYTYINIGSITSTRRSISSTRNSKIRQSCR